MSGDSPQRGHSNYSDRIPIKGSIPQSAGQERSSSKTDPAVRLRANFIRDLVTACGGRVRFDRWMSEALTNPDFGYYTTGIRGIGERGDFSTWPGLDSSLAKALAAWLKFHRKPWSPWHMVEIGAGDGSLAAGIRSSMGWLRKPRMHMVEISPKLAAWQKTRIKHALWHESLTRALQACRGHALLVANELVDAFPCRVFRKVNHQWLELSIALRNGQAEETWEAPATPLPTSKAFSESWPEGQRIEVHESFFQWLQEWRNHWLGGRMVIIDYGDLCPELYHRRPGGTLRAYAHHQRFEGRSLLDGFGRRDLTADVNFSDLSDGIAALGLSVQSTQTLGQWIANQGVAINESRLGDAAQAFKVLEFAP